MPSHCRCSEATLQRDFFIFFFRLGMSHWLGKSCFGLGLISGSRTYLDTSSNRNSEARFGILGCGACNLSPIVGFKVRQSQHLRQTQQHSLQGYLVGVDEVRRAPGRKLGETSGTVKDLRKGHLQAVRVQSKQLELNTYVTFLGRLGMIQFCWISLSLPFQDEIHEMSPFLLGFIKEQSVHFLSTTSLLDGRTAT